MPQTTSKLLPSQRMRIAYLLTAVGGYLDAYTYFERGGVFANAQTGNIVKLGIAIANGSGETFLLFLLPIAAFTLGLMTSLYIEISIKRMNKRFIRRSVLAAEAFGLAVVGFIPSGEQWNIVANCIVSFVAAMQYETFTNFRGDAIATTMTTGNLRKMVDCLFVGVMEHDPERLVRAARFASIVVTFAVGACVGTLFCDHMGHEAVMPAVLMLLVAIATISILHRKMIGPRTQLDA